MIAGHLQKLAALYRPFQTLVTLRIAMVRVKAKRKARKQVRLSDPSVWAMDPNKILVRVDSRRERLQPQAETGRSYSSFRHPPF